MKTPKLFTYFFALVFGLFLLNGCSKEETETPKQQTETIPGATKEPEKTPVVSDVQTDYLVAVDTSTLKINNNVDFEAFKSKLRSGLESVNANNLARLEEEKKDALTELEETKKKALKKLSEDHPETYEEYMKAKKYNNYEKVSQLKKLPQLEEYLSVEGSAYKKFNDANKLAHQQYNIVRTAVYSEFNKKNTLIYQNYYKNR